MKAWLILLIVVLSAGCVSVDLAPHREDTAAKAFAEAGRNYFVSII